MQYYTFVQNNEVDLHFLIYSFIYLTVFCWRKSICETSVLDIENTVLTKRKFLYSWSFHEWKDLQNVFWREKNKLPYSRYSDISLEKNLSVHPHLTHIHTSVQGDAFCFCFWKIRKGIFNSGRKGLHVVRE